MELTTSGRRLFILSTLYFVQGLPFGFQATALPTYLRQRGLSLSSIALLGVLASPWMLKALWAPLVDRYGSARIGRRRSWILPMQAALAATCVVAALVPIPSGLPVLLGLVLLMNLFAATMDIAVDGLAVDLLQERELGPGNAAQVVGYKVGMLTGGGLLVWASGSLGWSGLLAGMAVLVVAVLALTLTWREPPSPHVREGEPPPTLKDVVKTALQAFRLPGAGWLFAYIATYKLGESMIDVMFKPFLIDQRHTPATLGLWLGTYGMIASVGGSLFGGLAASRMPIWTALAIASVLRAGPLFGEWWLALAPRGDEAIIGVIIAEHFFGGTLTTLVFAFMMARVDPRVGATHYTVLATLEVLGKSPPSYASGWLAERLGYAGLFALGTAISVLFLVLLVPLRSVPERARG